MTDDLLDDDVPAAEPPADDLDAKWQAREERITEGRKRANKVVVAALVALVILALAGCGLWRYFSGRSGGDGAAEDAATSAGATDTLTPGLDEQFPEGTFEIGDEVRVAKGKDAINQRKEPRTDAFVVTTLGWPQLVRVLDRTIPEGDDHVWYLVVSWDGTNEGPRGWVRGDLLERQ